MTAIHLFKMRLIFADLLANVYVWFGAITVWQEQLDYWLKIVVALSAISVSMITIYYTVKRNKNKKDQ